MRDIKWSVLRLIVLPIIRFFYRIKVIGRENLPASGGALLICNHNSYSDVVVLGAAAHRPVRFIIFRDYYYRPILGAIVRLFKPIPVSSADTATEMRRSIETVVAALKAGELVCIFPEGAMTRTGHLQSFKRGLELFARRAEVPIIPAYIDGMWGSLFSFQGGRFFLKWPRPLIRNINLVFGAALPPKTTAWQARQAVLAAGAVAFAARKDTQQPLHAHFIRIAKKRWRKPCMADSTGVSLTWGRTLAGSLTLARWMERHCSGQKMVGMMMPASVGAALVNVGALMSRRVPVNLNFTSSRAALDQAIKCCELRTVFTSRALIQKTGIPERPEFIYLEELLASISGKERAAAYALSLLLPRPMLERVAGGPARMDDLATIMFTSGSTGVPKGVMLTHHNIVSDIEAFSDVLKFDMTDTMVGVLPLFHSFGFTATLWAPLTREMRVVYHPNPLDAKGVGALVEKHGGTIICGTSSFYAMYTRGCKPEQFRSLRLVVAGGQKLNASVAAEFKEKFGIEVREGYGCTETSPVVAVSCDDVRHGTVFQRGSRTGSVGKPIPGLLVSIVHPDTGATLGPNESGLVLVRGAIVMQQYMDDPQATAAAMRDGAYDTRDIGLIDEDGFLFIEDRLSRFSKIGGEMVPHNAVEEAIQAASADADRRFAVVTLPDKVRGEKLAVAYTGGEMDIQALLKTLAERGIPNLWLPAAGDFKRVDAIPLLATGKPDLLAVRKLLSETD